MLNVEWDQDENLQYYGVYHYNTWNYSLSVKEIKKKERLLDFVVYDIPILIIICAHFSDSEHLYFRQQLNTFLPLPTPPQCKHCLLYTSRCV